MGTTLTGTTPQDTYDSLIKVTDNGPLTGSLKKLTDGLGNDSSLSLSTTAASLSGTLAVTGASTFSSAITMALGGSPRLTLQDTDAGAGNVGILFQESTSPKWTLASVGGNFAFFNEATSSNAIYVSSTNNVGIGTSSPAELLHLSTTLAGSTGVGTAIQINSGGAGGDNGFIGVNKGSGNGLELSVENRDIIFNTGASTPFGGTERFRITANGVTFNGDTAAANALDDYEEGTWTMGVSFGGASTGVTYDASTSATYTKIGRQVTVNGFVALTNKGSSTGSARITGLPFTIANSSGYYSAAAMRLQAINFVGQFQAYGTINSTTILLQQTTTLGVNTDITDTEFSNSSQIMISFTYFV